jgi:DNA-directed RNA polymerase, mitochondrial
MDDRKQLDSGIMAGSIVHEQIDLELYAVEKGTDNYWKMAGEAIRRGDGAALKPSERLLVWWMPMLREKVVTEQEAIRRGEPGIGRQVYGPAMLLLPADRIALLALHEAVGRCLQADGVTLAEVSYAIGAAILGEACLDALKAEKPDVYAEITRICKTGIKPRHGATWAKKELQDPIWSRKVSMHLGAKLIEMILTLPGKPRKEGEKPVTAWRHKLQRDRGKDVGVIRLGPEVMEQIAAGHSIRAKLRPSHLPMLIQPFAWTKTQAGGYVRVRVPIVSKLTPHQKQAINNADMTWAFDGLNAINSSAWRVNDVTLGALEAIKEHGGNLCGVPRQHEYPLPAKPKDMDQNPKAKADWKKEAKGIHRKNKQLCSEVKVFDGIVETAATMKGRNFYFPSQFDFRFRAYPIPPGLNHYGADVARGLLMASEPAPLGPNGMHWIKVHAANSAGKDKMEFQSRAEWTDRWIQEHRAAEWIGSLETIHRAAADTWAAKDIDNPAQFLAAIVGLFYPDYGKRLPIQRDGCANGLQHYAALGRDPMGAEAVSLCGSYKPGGVYSQVADLVRESVAADVASTRVLSVTVRQKNYSYATGPIARAVLPHVGREMAKPIVMRKVYGVTEYGAKNTLRDFLREVGVKMEQAERYCATKYLVGKIMDAIGKVCSAAREIMDWLASAATACVANGDPLGWTTPLGLPVVQPYRRWQVVQIRTSLQWLNVLVENEDAPIAKRKHVTTFAPNFIHSIDASHMMMTAVECSRRSIWFAAVHDSFWCRPGDVDSMDRILREQFVKLHNVPILENLRDELASRYPKARLPELPTKGSFDINQVLGATYAFH